MSCRVEEKQSFQGLDIQSSFQEILDFLTTCITLYDLHHSLAYANRKFFESLEYTREELIGLPAWEIANKIYCEKNRKHIIMELQEGEHYRAQTRTVRSKTGRVTTIKLEVFRLQGGYLCLGEAVKTGNRGLDDIQQQEKLIVLGQMAAGVVHEIRNPLTAVKGFSQLIDRVTQDERVKEYARLIHYEIDRLNQVVSDFLKYAKPRTPVYKQVDVNTLLENIVLLIESYAFLKRVRVNLELGKMMMTIYADEEQIKQVVLNLVQNAVEAMNEVEDPRLDIFTGYRDEEDEVYITVKDNGKGMTREQLNTAGSPFYTTKEKGTGLGLSICKQIAQHHCGRLHIESEPGRGTVVTLYLPVTRYTC